MWLVAIACGALPARAQEPQIQLYDLLRPPAPLTREDSTQQEVSAEPAEAGDLGPQQLLVPGPAAHPLQVFSTTDYLYDSNILLLDNNRESDGVLDQRLGASYTLMPLNKLSATLFATYELIRYTDHNELDFDANTVGLSLNRPIGNSFTVYGGFQALRMYLSDGDDEFYKTYDTTFGLWRGQTVGDRGWFFYGYQLDWFAASPSEFTRVDNAAYAGLKVMPTDKLAIQLLYRFRADEYLQTDRTDLNNLVSLTASYSFNNYVSVRAYVSYANNSSDESGFDYNVFTSGGGLSLQVRF